MTKVLFSDDHEYVKIEDGIGTVGITDYAQKALGDVVYVELPKVGDSVEKGGQAGVVESVKSASEIYSPVTGEIVEINEALTDDPALVNSDPQGAAWFYKIKIANDDELGSLKDEGAYNDYIAGL
ncbi:MAG: glycine cleavage system protein GcvH [Alphaproteobacteria bacterium]|nr:glycine cleavage system protein GcvH [Alphaproteobacteria bacterium]